MKKNERLQALHILTHVIQDGTPLLHSMQAAPDLSPLSKELCFGVCRHYERLQALADCWVTKRPKQIDVWLCLLMGLYQLHYLRIPDYAVVKETVGLLTPIKKPWAKGLVNAVLRHYCREQEAVLLRLSDNLAFQYGHPAWLIKRIQQDWPDDWQTILKCNDIHPPMTLRINAQHVTAKADLLRLQDVGMDGCAAPNRLCLSRRRFVGSARDRVPGLGPPRYGLLAALPAVTSEADASSRSMRLAATAAPRTAGCRVVAHLLRPRVDQMAAGVRTAAPRNQVSGSKQELGWCERRGRASIFGQAGRIRGCCPRVFKCSPPHAYLCGGVRG